jgi:hypothetical protein
MKVVSLFHFSVFFFFKIDEMMSHCGYKVFDFVINKLALTEYL